MDRYRCCGGTYCRCSQAAPRTHRARECEQDRREQYALGEAARAMGQWPRNE